MKAKIVFVEVEGSDEVISEAIKTFGQLFTRSGASQAALLGAPANPVSLPVPENDEAIPQSEATSESDNVASHPSPAQGPPPARVHKTKRRIERGCSKMVKCRETGKVMTIEDAAEMCGVKVSSMRIHLSPSQNKLGVGRDRYHFGRAPETSTNLAPRTTRRPTYKRPGASDVMPANPNRIGGSVTDHDDDLNDEGYLNDD